MTKIQLKLKRIIPFLFLLLTPLRAFAQSLVPANTPSGANVTFCDFFSLGQNVINFALDYIVFPLAILMIIVAGVMFIMSGANPSMRGRANSLIKDVVIGVAIILLAWVIINTVFLVLTGNNTPSGFPWPWNSINC